MLLDGPDVIPHINLNAIAGLNDGDTSIPSDLPYASSAGWSRQAANFLSVTRVVGRLPAAEGEPESSHLVDLITAASTHQAQPAASFHPPFAIGADVWKVSTQLSVTTTFGPGTSTFLCPPDAQPATDPDLSRLAHFINCHGGQADPQFYGQSGTSYPVALASNLLGPHLSAGAVAAAECCYGAELYNYTMAAIDPPICMTYLLSGACAFVGSTNIAYGPTNSNAQADLLTQYFMQHVLQGIGSGSALLQARQKFVQGQIMSSPANLKTLAQFILLGDPSLHPCTAAADGPDAAAEQDAPGTMQAATAAVAASEVLAPVQDRKMRRLALHGVGLALGASATKPGSEVEITKTMRDRLSELARAQGLAPKEITMLTTSGGTLYNLAAKAAGLDRKVAVVVDRTERLEFQPGPSIKLMVAHIIGDRIVKMEVSESR